MARVAASPYLQPQLEEFQGAGDHGIDCPGQPSCCHLPCKEWRHLAGYRPRMDRWPCVRLVSLSRAKSLVASLAAELVATAKTWSGGQGEQAHREPHLHTQATVEAPNPLMRIHLSTK